MQTEAQLNLTPKGKVWKVLKKENRGRQGESRTEKQWHTRLEAQPLCYEQHADYMTNRPFYSNCVMPRD